MNSKILIFYSLLCLLPLLSNAATYKYVDENGVAHYVDSESKIPEQYRQKQQSLQLEQQTLSDQEKNQMQNDLNRWRQQLLDNKQPQKKPRSTGSRVQIRGNGVLVPVIIGYRDREIKTTLLLDTGATITVLDKSLGSRLRVKHLGRAQFTLADDSQIYAPVVKLDYVIVGGHKVENVYASLFEAKTQRQDQGLLGMNVLRNFNYSIDFERQRIRWRPKSP